MEQYSVLMSVYYKENPAFLRQSIESMLCQTVPTNDFVLVCDGPLTPELDEVIEEFERENLGLFQIVRIEKNGGLGPALNLGLTKCKNELVARMDSDDISMEDRCECELIVFEKQKVDIVSGTISEFDGSIENCMGLRVLPQTQDKLVKFGRRRNPFNHACAMFRKKSVIAAGSYQPFAFCEDYYLWVRMLQNGAVGYNIPQILLYVRTGDEMYRRRAGFRYLKTILFFKWRLKKIGFSGWIDFLISGMVLIISTMIPNSWRIELYKKILRKSGEI